MTSLANRGYVFGCVGFFVCLFASNITQKDMNRLQIIFMEGSGWYNEELIKVLWRSEIDKCTKNTIIVVAWLDRLTGNDPVVLGLVVHHHGPTFINA